ncbi:hypothetical protein HYV57_01240 [Candidatus Peregrinibacteria bacterium]|nr:hypothetical protein [Candidatus Peregrinibacteria bacterium]
MLYNWHIIGHAKTLEALESELRNKNISHAYLFAGPEEIGKYAVAQTFAGILQCQNNFCHTCPTCIQVKKGHHYDTIEMLDDGTSIKIETIREVIAKLHLSAQSVYKILLLQNIERLTAEAANCLLKTLEEPPPKTLFLLTTSNLRVVKSTILSRVRIHSFRLVSKNILYNELRKRYGEVPEKTLLKIISFALGKPGKALKLINDSELLQWYENTYNDIEIFLKTPNITKQFSYIDRLIKDEKQTMLFLDIALHFLRNLMLKGMEKPEVLETFQKSIPFLADLIREAQKTKELIGKNVNMKLACENFMLKF